MEKQNKRKNDLVDFKNKSKKSKNESTKPKRSKKTKRVKTDEEREREKMLRERSAKHKKTVEEAMRNNKEKGLRGKVAVNKLPHYRSKDGSPKMWPNKDGYLNINVCSSAKGIFSNLSPMKCGPVEYQDEHTKGVVKVTNVENLWQFSKVWEGETNKSGDPINEFFERRALGWKNPKGVRHVKKGNGINRNIPLFSYWKGKKLSYLEARKEIYCPEYSKAVIQTDAYKQLNKLLDDGYNIQIVGYDGYDYQTEGKTLKECFDDKRRPFGHEIVLVCLLLDDKPWEDNGKEEVDEENENESDEEKEEYNEEDDEEEIEDVSDEDE